ncbi:WxcM-like domain-containing protein [Rasiella rasia]|uniref:WxcM-like domain-containing protein n=1 Tax=Rasiella rasia TaxID=2744027 RepID=A0A6G6GKJ3_9FLAO|nr:FdtA/QdtA family cupin domain-containing protein [Rasiella rasia]QIE59079.1 WxcM-like domain-containing protein [Rasiella rasia]
MKYVDLEAITLKDIPKIIAEDGRGNLSVVEKELLPYEIKRVYYLYDVPSDSIRGGHAHKELQQFLIAVSGSFSVVLDNGKERKTFLLNRPNKGLLIPSGVWRELENFSAGAVCLSLVSQEYDEDDYIRDYTDFKSIERS